MSTNGTEIPDFGNPPLFVAQEWGAFRLSEAVSADSVSASGFGMLLSQHGSQLGLSEQECEKSGPRSKIRKIPENAGPVEQVTQFSQAATRLNFLRNLEGSLRPTASG